MIILLAAQIKAKTYEPFKRNNIDATARVIEAARKHGVDKIFHFSSASVLSIRKDAYAKTKKASEQLVLKSKLTYIVIRPSMMYGPLDNKNIGWLINFSKKIPIFPIAGDGKYHRQPMYIDDVSKLVIKMMHLLEKGTLKNQTYSINGPILEFGYMCKTVVKKVGGLRFTVHVPIPIFKFAMKIYNLVAPDPQFTTDQVDSLTSGDVFDRWEWWKEYNIKITPFDRGVEKMLHFKPRHL
jgi:nucleoside-diphosphate-sugar epimerase